MIEFYKFAPQFGLRDASPFVLKLETYLRLAGLDYNANIVMDPRKAPKGKLPYIVDDGKTISDSTHCIDHLKEKYGDPLGKGLTAEQRAIGHAVKTMLEERTYWALVNLRWMEPQNAAVIRDTWFGEIPAFLRGFVFGKIIKDMKKGMQAHGIGRHSDAEIYAFAIDDLKTVEAILGDKPYLLGSAPSEYDASVYGLFANFMAKPFPSKMSAYIQSSKTLSAYIDRMEKEAFG